MTRPVTYLPFPERGGPKFEANVRRLNPSATLFCIQNCEQAFSEVPVRFKKYRYVVPAVLFFPPVQTTVHPVPLSVVCEN